MNPLRVLVTGAGGFIGQHLVRDQLVRRRQVRALDCNATTVAHHRPTQDLEIMVGDVADVATQEKAVAGIDIVFHLASAHLEVGLSDHEYQRINVAAVETLLRECHRAGVHRFIHMSSSSVHGRVENPPADEEAPFRPDIVYERTKLAGELAALDFYRRFKFPVVVVRPTWVYGPGCKRTARLFQTIADGTFVMVGKGSNVRSSIYISDLLDALERCATCQGIDGEVFLLTHEELVTVRQIVEAVARLAGAPSPRICIPVWLAWTGAGLAELTARSLGRTPPISRRSLKFFTNDAAFTCTKARRMLGFQPQVPIWTGLERTYQAWCQNGGGQ